MVDCEKKSGMQSHFSNRSGLTNLSFISSGCSKKGQPIKTRLAGSKISLTETNHKYGTAHEAI